MSEANAQKTRLEANLLKASQALKVFPLQANGLVDEPTRESTRFRMALRAYAEAKAAMLKFNRIMNGEGL